MKYLLIGIGLILFSSCRSRNASVMDENKITADTMNTSTTIKGTEFNYQLDTLSFKGYLAYDTSVEGKRPGILVVHEFWGSNEYSRRRARMLAGLGYTAFALDMYGNGQVAETPDMAGKLAGAVRSNPEAALARFSKALEILKQQETVDTSRIAAIGYCFGGGIVLQMARAGLPLKAVVSFHGGLGTNSPARKGIVKASILVCNGGADAGITPEIIKTFKNEMDAASVPYTFISYEGAKHAFTNPDADIASKKFNMTNIGYNEAADMKSWQDMIEFFNRVLK